MKFSSTTSLHFARAHAFIFWWSCKIICNISFWSKKRCRWSKKKHFQAIEIIFDVIIISICYTNARCNQNNILHVVLLLLLIFLCILSGGGNFIVGEMKKFFGFRMLFLCLINSLETWWCHSPTSSFPWVNFIMFLKQLKVFVFPKLKQRLDWKYEHETLERLFEKSCHAKGFEHVCKTQTWFT